MEFDVFKAFVSGYTWFVLFVAIFFIAIFFSCKYYDKPKERGECVEPYSCGLCLNDKVIMFLIIIIFSLMLIHMIKMKELINKYNIDAAKYDSYLMTIITEHEHTIIKK